MRLYCTNLNKRVLYSIQWLVCAVVYYFSYVLFYIITYNEKRKNNEIKVNNLEIYAMYEMYMHVRIRMLHL